MAYSNEKSALHLLSQVSFASTAIKGVTSCSFTLVYDRDTRLDGGRIAPISRPLSYVDCIFDVTFLDPDSFVDPVTSTTPSDIDISFEDGNADTPSISLGSMLPGNFNFQGIPKAGGMPSQQQYVLEGSAIDLTITMP